MNRDQLRSKFSYMFENTHYGNLSFPIGWSKLVFHLLTIIDQMDPDKYIRIEQIKSKFAGLRCYISWHGPKRKPTIHDRIVDLITSTPWFMRRYLVRLGLPIHKKWDPTHEKIYNLIQHFENASFRICEDCGAPGSKVDNGHWWFTLCNKCSAERESMDAVGEMLRNENLLGSGHLQPQDI